MSSTLQVKLLLLIFILLSLPTNALATSLEEGQKAYKEKNYKDAYKILKPYADQGEAIAQANLGRMYYKGLGVKQDSAEALKWVRLAADQGNASAQNMAGHIHYTELNYHEAVKWYRLAAEQGLASSQYNLGRSYFYGEGPRQNTAQAMRWLRLAADQGLSNAQNFLGVIYDKGIDLKQDKSEALKWYHLAAEQQNPQAIENLDTLIKETTKTIYTEDGFLTDDSVSFNKITRVCKVNSEFNSESKDSSMPATISIIYSKEQNKTYQVSATDKDLSSTVNVTQEDQPRRFAIIEQSISLVEAPESTLGAFSILAELEDFSFIKLRGHYPSKSAMNVFDRCIQRVNNN